MKGFKARKDNPTEYQRFLKLHAMLPIGSDNAVSKDYVACLWNMDERPARKIMTEKMRMYGLPVCNLQGGYFVPRNSIEQFKYLKKHNGFSKTVQRNEHYIKSMYENMVELEKRKGINLSPLDPHAGQHKQSSKGTLKSSAASL